MDYEIGSIADLISGSITPGRNKVTITPLKPVKKQIQNDDITPTTKQAPPLKKNPKINMSFEKIDRKPDHIAEKIPKKKKKNKVKTINDFGETFKFLSEISDDDVQIEDTISDKKMAEKMELGLDLTTIVKEYFVGKDGKEVPLNETTAKKRKHDNDDEGKTTKKKKNSKRAEDAEEQLPEVKKKKKNKKAKDKAPEDEADEIENVERAEEVQTEKQIDDADDTVPEMSDFQKAAERRINSKFLKEQKFDDEELARTLFVGNIPISILSKNYEKIFKQMFKPHGEVESVRIRNIPVKDLKEKPKVALIEKNFHPERSSVTAYIKFNNAHSVTEALVLNNALLDGNNLRVDRCSKGKQSVDAKKSIFLGNLPFNVEEQTIRNTFDSCGEIVSVRIVRDRKTQIGKGIAFVNFTKSDGVEMALAMAKDEIYVGKKAIRVTRYINNAKERKSNNPREDRMSRFGKGDRGNGTSRFERGPKPWSQKKRDEQGNKIRKYKSEDRPGRKFRPKLDEVNSEAQESEAKTENGENVTKKDKLVKHQEFKGLMAFKKKKIKKNKAILEKKKISKILMQPPKD